MSPRSYEYQDEIVGNFLVAPAFRPFYGDEIAARLNNLITEHLVITAKAFNNAEVEEAERRCAKAE